MLKKLSSTFKVMLALMLAVLSNGLAPVASVYAATPDSSVASVTQKPWICHPVNGKGETGNGWNLIDPDNASSHIDESLYPDGEYWKHMSNDGLRHDTYTVDGACPGEQIDEETLVECTTFDTVHATNLDTNGWTLGDGASFVDGGVKLSVDGNWDETAITRPLDGKLSSLGTGIDFTPDTAYLGLHVETSAGTLVYEKDSSYAGKWWSKSYTFNAPEGMGYPTFDTLENLVANNPDVTLISLSVLYTNPNTADETVTSVKIGCKEYTFNYEKEPIVELVECSEVQSIHATNLDTKGWTLGNGASFVEDGVKLSTPGEWKSSTISRPLTGELRDLGDFIDFAPNENYLGLHVVTSAGTLSYEKYYENQNPANAGKWWSEDDFHVASGMGYATFDTLENIVAANPGVTLQKLYVLYTNPEEASVTVTSATIGCTEYTFDYEKAPEVPTVPETPVTPQNPGDVLGDNTSTDATGKTLGTQTQAPSTLPATGSETSFHLIGAVLAALTYAVIFRRQSEYETQ